MFSILSVRCPRMHNHNSSDIDSNKSAAMSAYLIFCLPLMVARHSRFAMYHANQGLLLLLYAVFAHLMLGLLPGVEDLLMPPLDISVFALAFIGIRNAHDGRMRPLPFIGKFVLVR